MVDDKIHGTFNWSLLPLLPSSLAVSQFGGQRFGEMWRFGHCMHTVLLTSFRILTAKSDDTNGRVKTYGVHWREHSTAGILSPS